MYIHQLGAAKSYSGIYHVMQTPINKFQDSVTNKIVSYPVWAIPSSGHPKMQTFTALSQAVSQIQ